MARESFETAFATPTTTQRANRVTPIPPVQNFGTNDPLEDRIRLRAYLLAEASGFPAGRADEFWLRAEREIRSGKSR